VADHHVDAPTIWNNADPNILCILQNRLLNGSRLRRAAFALLMPTWVILLFVLRVKTRPIRSVIPLIVFLSWILWETSSITWSKNTNLSVRRVTPWLITCITGCVTGVLLGVTGSVVTIFCMCLLFLLAGIGNECLQGSFFQRRGYRFAGTLHPNQQALNCAVLALLTCQMSAMGAIPLAVTMVCMTAVCAGTAVARSRTGLWSAAAAAAWWALWAWVHSYKCWPGGVALGVILSSMPASAVTSQFSVGSRAPHKWSNMLSSQLMSLGRSTRTLRTLTGRLGLWKLVLGATRDVRTAGVGFGAFWSSAQVAEINGVTGWRFADCHSAYVETATRSGLIGLGLLIAMVATGVIVPLSSAGAAGPFLSSFFVLVAIHAIFESTFVVPNFASLSACILIGCACT